MSALPPLPNPYSPIKYISESEHDKSGETEK